MSYNGSGDFSINSTGQPVVGGTVISSTMFNAFTADMAGGFDTAFCRDGQAVATGDFNMGNNQVRNMADGTLVDDAATVGQLQTGVNKYVIVSGTDTYTGTMNPAYTAYATGDTFWFVVPNTNTGAATLNIDGVGAKALTKNGTQALVAGDLIASSLVSGTYDGTRIQMVNTNIQTNLVWVDGGGTADAITATYAPAIPAVIDGLIVGVRATAANTTTTPTFSPNSLTARTIVKLGDQALVVGDIFGDGHELLLRYRASDTKWELLNPAGFQNPMTTRGDIIYRNATVPARLAIGAANTALVSDGTDPSWGAVVRPAVSSTISVGYPATPYDAGTQSSGTYTPSIAQGAYQTAVNGGAHTLAPPSADGTLIVQYTNNGSAGAITTSGFTKVTGAFTTTNADDFFAYITKVGSFSYLNIVALQ